MEEKLKIIRTIFGQEQVEDTETTDNPVPKSLPIQHGKYYGGVYNGRKYMYSEHMIQTLSAEKLEAVIKNQIGYSVTP